MGPEVLAVASLAGTAGSTFMGMKGASDTAASNSAASLYQAQIAKNNQIIADQNAERSIIVGERDAENQNYKTKATLGTQKATQAANGVDVNSGSALDVRKSTAELGALDALTILNNAQTKATGYKNQSAQFASEENLYKLRSDNQLRAGKNQEMASLIGGASSFSDKWLGYQQKGTFG